MMPVEARRRNEAGAGDNGWGRRAEAATAPVAETLSIWRLKSVQMCIQGGTRAFGGRSSLRIERLKSCRVEPIVPAN